SRVRHTKIPCSSRTDGGRSSDAAGAAPLRNLRGIVGRTIVNNYDLKARAIREPQRVQAARKVHGPVVDRYDYTQPWRRHMLVRVSRWTGYFRHSLRPAFSAVLAISR